MVDQHPDALKLQAEAALKRLEEARLHERCPKACKSCSQKHRKCQFKNGHYPKCDLCAKNGRECEIIPTPPPRRNDDSGHAISQQQQYAAGYGYPASTTLAKSRKTSLGPYAGGSPTGSPVDPRSSGPPSSSYPYGQPDAYSYGSSTSPTHVSSSTHGSAYQSLQPQYGHYPSGHGNPQHHGHSLHTQPERDSTPYYVPSQSHGQPSPSSYWSDAHGAQAQSAQAGAGQSYGYSSGNHPTSPVRQASTTNVPSIHTGSGQPYIRTTHGYPLASPASPGGSYSVSGNSVYLPSQQPSSVRYGAGASGQGYDQNLSSANPGSVNEGSMYYQPGLHQ